LIAGVHERELACAAVNQTLGQTPLGLIAVDIESTPQMKG
jgi:hypothetical protein